MERWEIAPAVNGFVQAAKYLPGQIERIRQTEFGHMEDVLRDLRGGYEIVHGATMGFRLRDVDLVNGVLYAPGAVRHLRPRAGRVPPLYGRPEEVVKGALYETWNGNRWFGCWLLGDCLTYPLAEQIAQPCTTSAPPAGHQREYESVLAMNPRRIANVHFEELVIFHDVPSNEGKRQRAREFRERVIGTRSYDSHPGVFLVRGSAGDKRVLTNEQALCEHLARTRGFRILDPLKSSLDEIARACAGAKVVAGVEGSHLVHGLMLMPKGSALFVIQPPERVCSVLKAAVDSQEQVFSFLVAEGGRDEFTVDPDEVDRTLDLLH